jgi:hypothetical protein
MRAERIGICPYADRPQPTTCGQAGAEKSPGLGLARRRDSIRDVGQMHKAETSRACTTRQAQPLSQAPDFERTTRPHSTEWCETVLRLPSANFRPPSIATPRGQLSVSDVIEI